MKVKYDNQTWTLNKFTTMIFNFLSQWNLLGGGYKHPLGTYRVGGGGGGWWDLH